MPNWNDVLIEISQAGPSGLDSVRQKYLAALARRTGRHVIAYYSGWLVKNPNLNLLSIGDDDMNAFMTTVHGRDKAHGLDLILHTPGGNIAATESIVDYLRKLFGHDIRVFVPQLAMSAGTMIACAASEIFMGKQSSLGPIDPHFNLIPCHGVIEEFETAVKECKRDPGRIAIWAPIISKYHPTFIGECRNALAMSKSMVKSWLKTGMFRTESKAVANRKATKIVNSLSDHRGTKLHSRHLPIAHCQNLGLMITALEDDHDLQDAVLTVHHAYMHTFANSQVLKIVENHNGIAVMTA